MEHFIRLLLVGLGALAGLAVSGSDFQGSTHLVPLDEGVVQYSKVVSTGAVARLKARLDSGETRLERDDRFGYLLSVLRELSISTNSQMLVFSKTSFQRDRIDPRHPRALYFNDSVYIGYLPGSPLLELSEVDPGLGGVFYSLDSSDKGPPKLTRVDNCLECHASARSMGVPGHLAGSYPTDESGAIDLVNGITSVTDATPFADRWGGWYVTGTHGHQTHRGNAIGFAQFERAKTDVSVGGNRTNLDDCFDTTRYPLGQSDIVALMVFEHEAHLHNFIARVDDESRTMLATYGHVRYLRVIFDAFVKSLLFCDEAKLSEPVHGSDDFARTFADMGPADKNGRSLREFDLKTRLFKYPCSFLIYSEAFAALPKEAKQEIYQRLWNVLSGADYSEAFQHLDAKTRKAIAEILAATLKDLPGYWKV